MGLNIILKQFLHGSVYNVHGELRWTVTDNGFMFEMNGKEYRPEYNVLMEAGNNETKLGGSDSISAFNSSLFKMIAIYCYKISKNQELNSLSGWDFLEGTDMLNSLSGSISVPDVSWQCYEDGIRIIASGKEHIFKYTELYLYKEDYWHDIYPDVPFSLCQMLICFAVMIKSLVAKKPAVQEKKPEPAPQPAPVQQAAPAPQMPQQAPMQQTAQMPQQAPMQQAAQMPQQAPMQRAVQMPQQAPMQQAQMPQQAPMQQAAQMPQQAPMQRTAQMPQQAPMQQRAPQPVQQAAPVQQRAPQPAPQPTVAVQKAPSQMAPQSIAPVTAPKNPPQQDTPQIVGAPMQRASVATPAAANLTGADAELAQLSPLELQALQDYFDEMCLDFKNIEKSVRKYYPAWDLEDISGLVGIEFIRAFIKKIS